MLNGLGNIAGNAGFYQEYSYAKIILTPTGLDNALEVITSEGFIGFELGDPADSNTSASGGNGTYAVITNGDKTFYPNAMLTVLSGSDLAGTFAQLEATDNCGAGTKIKLVKNSRRVSVSGTGSVTFEVRCFKNPGINQGYNYTGNGQEQSYVRFPVEIQMISQTPQG